MWHEARRQERMIRGLMVDYKKRADRRREFYQKIKLDPTQFLRVYGRPYKINYDPSVAMAAESPQSMMPWQGDTSNMIDRFDVRAHLDMIPDVPTNTTVHLSKDEEEEERQCNYERYRTLVENEASGLTEEQCLHEIYIDEHFGPPTRPAEEEKKKGSDKKAAIGYTYEDSTPATGLDEEDDSSDESSDTDVETADLDVTLDVNTLTSEQEVEINSFAHQYGMKDKDFVNLLRRDKEELEALKYAKQMEEEKAQFSGRKSRRERRAFKEKQLQGRRLSPPSYAARSSPKYEPYKRGGSSSRSRSRSPEEVGQVKFITSFGADSDEEGGPVVGPSLPPPSTKSDRSSRNDSHSDKMRQQSWKHKSRPSNLRDRRDRSRSRSRSRSPGRSFQRRSDSRGHYRRDRRSRSRSYERQPADYRDRPPDYRGRPPDYRDRPPDYRERPPDFRDRPPDYRDRRGRYRDWPRMGRYDHDRYNRDRYDRDRYDRDRFSSWGPHYQDRNRSRSRGYRRSRSRSRVSRSVSRSRSRSNSRSSSRSSSRSKSRSKSRTRVSPTKSHSKEKSKSGSPQQPPVVVKRYRRDSLSSQSSISEGEEDAPCTSAFKKDGASMSRNNKSGGAGSSLLGKSGGQTKGKLTPQERLKRRMQAQLNRQYKADKKAENSKLSKIEQERIDREEDLRNRTMEMRRREREKRHREMAELEKEQELRGSDSDSDDDKRHMDSDSGSCSPMDTKSSRRSRSRSRSRSSSGSRSTSSERVGLVSY